MVFCEGDTEYNYIDGMRVNQGVELELKPINMNGGGYSNFLENIKCQAKTNCIAKFIIIDLDRLFTQVGEGRCLKELIDYCDLQNKNDNIPHFLIVDNPDFEYLACLHIPEYGGKDTTKYITNVLGFKDLASFKSKKDIFDYLNHGNNSYATMLSKLSGKATLIRNQYTCFRNRFEIKNKMTIYWDTLSIKGSNIDDFYKIIEWK